MTQVHSAFTQFPAQTRTSSARQQWIFEHVNRLAIVHVLDIP